MESVDAAALFARPPRAPRDAEEPVVVVINTERVAVAHIDGIGDCESLVSLEPRSARDDARLPLSSRFALPIPDIDEEDVESCGSCYSHAEVIKLDDLDPDDLADLQTLGLDANASRAVVSRKAKEIRRMSFANSFARAKKLHASQKALVLARPEMQPINNSVPLVERCVMALTDMLDLSLKNAQLVSSKFKDFSALFTKDERSVIGELLREASLRLRSERGKQKHDLSHWFTPTQNPRRRLKALLDSTNASAPSKPTKGPWARACLANAGNENMLRAVVFGNHVIPGVQSGDSILMRMAGEYQRVEFKRKANRAELVDVPLSFSMTLLAVVATFLRLDCSVAYRRHSSRSASNRRGNAQAVLTVKTRVERVKLNFSMQLHGESPCTVIFRRPRTFSMKRIDHYADLVIEAKDILGDFASDIVSAGK